MTLKTKHITSAIAQLILMDGVVCPHYVHASLNLFNSTQYIELVFLYFIGLTKNQEGAWPKFCPNFVTFVLNACASIVATEEGRSAHEHIIQNGWDSDVKVGNCLVDMYAKCGSMGSLYKLSDASL
jgi:hypothetical protein